MIILHAEEPAMVQIEKRAFLNRTVSNHQKREVQVFYEVAEYMGNRKLTPSRSYVFTTATGDGFMAWRLMSESERTSYINQQIVVHYNSVSTPNQVR